MAEGASLVLTCEHAGREVPARYADRFATQTAATALDGHRGWDPGASDLAMAVALRLGAPLVEQHVTRLLVECNRSIGHPALWSDFSRDLSAADKERIVTRYWWSHRRSVERALDASPPPVVHVGVHTFTPVWNGHRRATDVGLLCDPSRPGEVRLVEEWRAALAVRPATRHLTVHRNRPYRGWTDGLTTSLRSQRLPEHYLGIELEVSQALVPVSSALVSALADGLAEAMGGL